MIEPVRAEARALFASSLDASDRVLVTGAGGWFGLTLAALLHRSEVPAMFTTQRPRQISFGTGTATAQGWNWNDVQHFAPTVVIDCAFILRDHIDSMTLATYVHENARLTSRLLQLAALDGVRCIVSVSSGAAIHPVDAATSELDTNPYGHLKRQAELAVRRLAEETGTTGFVARPFSVTGSLVTRPERYAFSNFVLQARTGTISIAAKHPVWRRFVGVDDFFAVALATAARGSGVLDSGGDLIEFRDLALRVQSALGKPADVTHADADGSLADDYASDDVSWRVTCTALGFTPATLDEQIVAVEAALPA